MTDQKGSSASWLQNWRERKRVKRERTDDSPEKRDERHAPSENAVDRMLRIGGVDREGRFKGD